MANMSYCRFQNTLQDLRDCDEALGSINNFDEIKSEEERKAAKRLVKLCKRIAESFEDEDLE